MAPRLRDRLLDVRPDRLDIRDREYMPLLRSLPAVYPDPEASERYLPLYESMILDQGHEGACTGFGLACLINYLLWSREWREQALAGEYPDPQELVPIANVSHRMLYHLARFYDEWPGEDYVGSSCRGAMKGWHRHGVCSAEYWPFRNRRGKVRFLQPKPGWQEDAASRPLGAYYRVNKDSISDLQAAIYEVGAVYVSARVHEGWFLDPEDELPIINADHPDSGGHAFVLIGYTPDGFIVQNSWGTDWGYRGFAILTYRDWVARGMDAWVAVLGAPANIQASQSIAVFRTKSLEAANDVERANLWFFRDRKEPYKYKNGQVQPWTEAKAYRHSLVMGNDGRLLNRLITTERPKDAAVAVCLDQAMQWLKSRNKKRLVVYGHGGLNDEEASITRTQILAPYFEANGAYPIFLCWKTGFGETLKNIIADQLWSRFSAANRTRVEGLGATLGNWRKKFADAKDRTIEVGCEAMVKPIWSQMKQNADMAALPGRGIEVLADCLKKLRKKCPDLEIHLVGHSAGSIILGHFLDLCTSDSLPLKSITMFAPACTVRFALDHYAAAIQNEVVKAKKVYFENLSDERELEDSVGPYGKSLLYLISRALEHTHKTPILGLERAWGATPLGFSEEGLDDIDEWRQFWRRKRGHAPKITRAPYVSDGLGSLPSVHGSFDNDVDVMTRTMERVRGSSLKYRVECLRGF
jgi:hypothetical protein